MWKIQQVLSNSLVIARYGKYLIRYESGRFYYSNNIKYFGNNNFFINTELEQILPITIILYQSEVTNPNPDSSTNINIFLELITCRLIPYEYSFNLDL